MAQIKALAKVSGAKAGTQHLWNRAGTADGKEKEHFECS